MTARKRGTWPWPNARQRSIEPAEGTRFVNLRFDVANAGERPTPMTCTALADWVLSDGQVAEGLALLGACKDTTALEAHIPPRAKITDACDIYQVPEGLEPARYVISDSGAVMPEWDLTGVP